MQALSFHPNTKRYDHDTCIKHNIHHPIGKHHFAKNSVHFDIPRIVNNCTHCISDKINTDSLHGFPGYIKTHFCNLTRNTAL